MTETTKTKSELMREDNDKVMARMKEESTEGKTCGAPHRMLIDGHDRGFRNQENIMGAVEDLTGAVKNGSSGASMRVGKFELKAKTAGDVVKIACAVVLLIVGLEYATRRTFPNLADKIGSLLSDKAVETLVESGTVGSGVAF